MAFSNPFAALAGDDDGSDAGDAPVTKQSTKPTTEVKKAAAAPAQKRFIPGQSKPQKQAEVTGTDATTGAPVGFEGERNPDARGTGFGRGRGGPRGRGERGTGARGGAGRGGAGARGGRTERPDRRSATGREDSAKAEHQGWGGDDGKRELEAEVEGATDAATEVKAGDEAKPAAEANGDEKTAEAAAPAAPAEEEDNSLTYEEYLKQKKDAPIAGVSQIQARKANEGADESQWKDGVVHTKEELTEFFTIEKQKQEKARKEKARKEKQTLEVEFTAPARQERGGERGGRGGRGRGDGARGARGGDRGGRGRGAAPRGAPRGGRAAAGGAKINVDDDKAFPSLA